MTNPHDELVERHLRELAAEDEMILVRSWPELKRAFTQAADHIATLARERDEARRFRRWNIERDGPDLVVRYGGHDKSEPCETERWVPQAALAASSRRAEELEGRFAELAENLDRMAEDRQSWADNPEIGGKKPPLQSHLRGKRYGYSHAAQLIRSAPSPGQQSGGEGVLSSQPCDEASSGEEVFTGQQSGGSAS